MSELMRVPKHAILQDGKKGPFRCDNCEYARSNATRCTHTYIIEHHADPEINVPLDASGKAIVTPGTCCDFIERIGKLSALVRST